MGTDGACSLLFCAAKAERRLSSEHAGWATPPNFRELVHKSALASRTKKVDRKDRALLKINSATVRTLRMLIEKYFMY